MVCFIDSREVRFLEVIDLLLDPIVEDVNILLLQAFAHRN